MFMLVFLLQFIYLFKHVYTVVFKFYIVVVCSMSSSKINKMMLFFYVFYFISYNGLYLFQVIEKVFGL